MKKTLLASLALAFVVVGLVGCNDAPPANSTNGETTGSTTTTTGETTGETTGAATGTTETPPPTPAGPTVVKEEDQKGPVTLEEVGEGDIAKRAPKDGEEIGVIKTSYGRIVVMFFPDKAPNMVKRFKEAAKKGIYKGTTFHRVIPGFMIQGGDPNSANDNRADDGQGGWGEFLKAEFNDVKHVPGILSTARTQDPNSAQSQFFVMHGENPGLDGQYTVFGKVLEGLKVVDTIVNLPRDQYDNPNPENVARVYNVEITKWPLK